VAGGRHAAGKHRSSAPSGGISRQKTQKTRLSTGGAPFAVAGVAVVAVAAAGGLTTPDQDNAANVNASSVPTSLQAIPLDRQISALRTDTSAIAQRASRAQERVSLEQRKAAAELERKRLEALRPKFVVPVAFGEYRLTASFGDSSGLWANRHTGQDFAAPTGTPIRAVADGVIVAAGRDGPYGWRIIVRHKDGTETWYCHMSAFVRRSGPVKAGQVIGKVGSSGNVTGPHLHLEVRINNEPINPRPWLAKHGVDI
jgi:murein DD-endopeptidase MepM/ murein hydrolase activator NlpD